MKKKINCIYCILLIVALFSCKNEQRKEPQADLKKSQTLATDSVSPKNDRLDTSFTLSFKSVAHSHLFGLAEQKAKEVLYKHFKKKELLTEVSLPDSLTNKDYENDCIYFRYYIPHNYW